MKMDGRQRWTAAMLCFSTVLVFGDMNLLGPNLTPVAKDMGLSDAERDWILGGLQSLLFFTVGAPASIIAGYWTDRTDSRLRLLLIFTLGGSIPCMLVYFANTWQVFLALRVFSGFAVGGASPIILSLISDLFPVSRRTLAGGAFFLLGGLGQAGGQVLGGVIGATLGWRYSFLLFGIPAAVVGLVTFFTSHEPERGAGEDPEMRAGEHKLSSLRDIVKVPTNVWIYVQAVFGCLPWGVMIAFLPDYVAVEAGFGVGNTSMIMLGFSCGIAVSTILSTLLGQYLQNSRPHLLGIFLGVSVFISVPLFLFMVMEDPSHYSVVGFAAIAAACGFCASPPGALVSTMLLNVNQPRIRGSVIAFSTLFNDISKGLGPLFGSILIQMFHSRQHAIALAILGWVPSAVILCFLSRIYPRDLDRVHHKMVALADDGMEMDVPGERAIHV